MLSDINVVSTQGSGSVPAGTILIWSGSIATIPSGFALCDGSNGTPDLRSRFVYGAGASYTKSAWSSGWDTVIGHFTPGVSGGEEQHILSIAEMPSHTHTPNDSIFNEGGFDSSGGKLAQQGYPLRISIGDNQPYAGIVAYNSLSYAGGNQPHNILPRFMTLAYIMKL